MNESKRPSGAGVARVVPLTLGWVEVDRSMSVLGDRSGRRIVEPVPAVACETVDGWLLLDTGLNAPLVTDPWLRARFYGPAAGVDPALAGDDPLPAALARAGIAIDDVVAVAVSHLHADHAGGIRMFAGRVPVYAQSAELAYGLSRHPEPEREGIFRIDFDDARIDWRLADGDVEIAPGVTALATPGHTPGHQSFVVRVAASAGGGGFVFAFDAADLTENVERELPIGGFIDCEPERTVDAIRRLKDVARREDLVLVPGHDPFAWPRLVRACAERFGRPSAPAAARSAR